MIHTVLLIAAFLCLFMAAVGVQTTKVNLLAAGLAFWVLSVLLP